MTRRRAILAAILLSLVAAPLAAYLRVAATGVKMTDAAQAYLATLTDKQRAVSQLEYDTPKRVDWHFIPKDHRKGLQIRDMKPQQRKAAHALLRTTLSASGYGKATKIMELEGVLRELEKDRKGGNIRDPERYYFTVFGKPTADSKWGLSIEGHHLSLNFVVDKNKVVSSTPTFFAANPGEVMADIANTKIKKGTRVLAKEEQYAFDLLGFLDAAQRKKAIIADKAPREIRAAGAAQPPKEAPVGLPAAEMNRRQRRVLKALILAYAKSMPEDIAVARLEAIEAAGDGKIHFAWAGADKPGVGHYYRIQGPSFLIEFVNTQPDAAGNPANHIHCVWRDMQGDFALPIGG